MKRLNVIFSTVLFSVISFVTTAIKLSFIVGSKLAFFSLNHCIMPLVGLYGGALSSTLLFGLKSLYSLFFTHNILLAYHFPTLSGSLYFSVMSQSFFKRLMFALIPLVCMMLFVLHPVGSQAQLYTLYWLIPFFTLLLPHNIFLLHALGSTWTAHAVGSVLWLYFHAPMPSASWIALIPVALVERTSFALGLTVCYYALHWIKPYIAVTIKAHVAKEQLNA